MKETNKTGESLWKKKHKETQKQKQTPLILTYYRCLMIISKIIYHD